MKPKVAQKVIPGAFPRRSLEYQKEHLTVAKEVGDRAGECKAYENLGNACRLQGYAKAIEYHTQCLAIAKEVGPGGGVQGVREPRHLVSVAGGLCKGHRVPHAVPSDCNGGGRPGGGGQERWRYGSLGISYQSQGGFAKAIEYQTQCLAIAKEVGNRAGEGKAYGNLGISYESHGDFRKAIDHHTLHLAIAREVGDRAVEGAAYVNLGTGHMYLNEYVKAVAYHKAQHSLAISLKHAHVQSFAALNMGVALTLHVRADRQSPATGADQAAPGAPHLLCGLRGRGAGTSQRAPLMACATGT